ncbi:Apocarotenoid-15,15'-oxygenase [Porphyridium purpureum]|uniref:Apocarotenoid-15,15'-oxygenase n=1 Tax=Porphyridium purpureum TaxID=35688 RepID=A0A5J4YJW7_PORPP|nr:Apocarotenoid-15,15'-oxygenase [Porphyridium purpureum]|eukprot:POR7689..scf291_13
MACFVGAHVVPGRAHGSSLAGVTRHAAPRALRSAHGRLPATRKRVDVTVLATTQPVSETKNQSGDAREQKKYLFESDEWSVHAFRELHRNCDEECDELIDSDAITGTLPPDLVGCLYSNGAGKYERSNLELQHPFEGDGMVVAISLYDGKVWFRNRFVRTRWFAREEKAGKYMFKNAFKTLKPGGWFANLLITKIKNPANVNVVPWAGKLMALNDQSFPWLLDEYSLATLGVTRLGNALTDQGEGGSGFTAHPRVDPALNRLVGLCFNEKRGSNKVDVCEFDDTFKLVRKTQFATKNMPFLHDMALSEKYAIVLDAPLKFEPRDFLLGQKAPAECLKFDPSLPCELILIPRDGDSAKGVVNVPLPSAWFCFHFSNAFEDRDSGETVIDMVATDKMILTLDDSIPRNDIYDVDWNREVPKSTLQRVRVKDGRVVSVEALCEGHVEFPKTNPQFQSRPYRYIYSAVHVSSVTSGALGPQGTAIQKLDLHARTASIYSGEREEFFSEPLFVPRESSDNKEEDDGYVLSIITNPLQRSSKLGIFDARRVSDGPVCTIKLPTFVPFRLHGSFLPQPVRREDMKRRTSTHEIFAGKGWNEVKSEFSSFGTNFLD